MSEAAGRTSTRSIVTSSKMVCAEKDKRAASFRPCLVLMYMLLHGKAQTGPPPLYSTCSMQELGGPKRVASQLTVTVTIPASFCRCKPMLPQLPVPGT